MTWQVFGCLYANTAEEALLPTLGHWCQKPRSKDLDLAHAAQAHGERKLPPATQVIRREAGLREFEMFDLHFTATGSTACLSAFQPPSIEGNTDVHIF